MLGSFVRITTYYSINKYIYVCEIRGKVSEKGLNYKIIEEISRE